MRLMLSPIPSGSHEIAIWPDLPPGDDGGEPFVTVCNLHHISDDECMVTKAMGRLSDATNVAIGLRAYGMGYRMMRFKVSHGSTVSRWAVYEKTSGGMDFYRVNLDEAVREYEGMLVESA